MKKIIFGIGLAMLLLIGCTGLAEDKGTLELRLTDAPALDIASLNVVISGVKIHSTEFGWVSIQEAPQTFDLIQLEDNDALLGSKLLKPGEYQQIRIMVQSAGMTLGDGTKHALNIPSGEVKLVGGFDIESGQKLTITLDFDAKQSVHQAGSKYQMRPTIKAIYGFIDLGELCRQEGGVWVDEQIGESLDLGVQTMAECASWNGKCGTPQVISSFSIGKCGTAGECWLLDIFEPTCLKKIELPSSEMSQELCNAAGATWNECGSICRIMSQGELDAVCTMDCKAICQCGTIAGLKCPVGFECRMPTGIVDAMGYCI